MFSRMLMLPALLLCVNMAVAMTDPMQPPAYRGKATATQATAAPRWQLTATLLAPNRRLATINGRTLRIGDVIAGAKLVAIQPASVTLEYQQRSIVLKLLPAMVKQPRPTSME
ncbi:MAG: general secretion pathway protein GspB [Gammaproteobacteria bacterium]